MPIDPFTAGLLGALGKAVGQKLFGACTDKSAASVLALVETFFAPPFPVEHRLITKETYDYRVEQNKFVPLTLTDTLICDLWNLLVRELKLSPEAESIRVGTVADAVNLYLVKDWRQFAGYRPWTHWNFIRSLTDEQRDLLAAQATAYIRQRGAPEKDRPAEKEQIS